MLRPYIMLTDARAPHPDWRRARVPGVAVARLAVPGSARLSGAPREIARSQARRRRERGASRAGVGRRDEAGGLVSDTKGWGGSHRAEQPPPTSSSLPNLPNLRWPPLVLRQRSDRRSDLAHRARVPAAG